MPIADWAARYIEMYSLALVPIPPGHKAPLHAGWNQPGGYVMDAGEARQRWGDLPNHGIGAVLGPSGLCSLDMDAPKPAEGVLRDLGVDPAVLKSAPTIQGDPSRYRVMFKPPPGVALGRKTLVWPARQTEKPLTLFELRAGAIQDVLPPTIHPGTGKPYTWLTPPNSEFPLLPEPLLEMWLHWESYRPELEGMCPWANHGFNPQPAPRGDGARPDVIAAFNRVRSVEELLAEHGYTQRGKRWISPTSSSGLAGVTMLDGRAFSHHASDPLAGGHAHDAFDIFRILDHGGDTRAAIKAAAEALGMGSTAGARARAGDEPGRDGGEDWPEPMPIQAALHPVPAFPAEILLPEALRAWIMDEADRMPCPPDFIAAAALVAIGSIIGARCSIKPKSRDDWLIVPNLWGGMVGPPSAKKSPSIGAALKPLDRLIALAMKTYEADMEDFKAKKEIFEAKEEGIKSRMKAAAKNPKKGNVDTIATELKDHRKNPPEEPTLNRYKTNDTTVEKLGELLREKPTGLLVLRDELVGLASWEREGHEGDRAFFLEAWNGNAGFDTDRIKRGSIFIPNLCVSIFGGIQPDKLTAYLEEATHALANDGMLQRFQLLVYPDQCPWEWRDRSPNRAARDAAFAVFETLADFNPMTWGAAPADDFNKFPHFRFDDAALEIFIEWSGDLHRSKLPAEEHPIIAQHLAKFDKLMPALALILHLAECAAAGQRGPVTAPAALRAAAWCDYLEAHARRCYGLLADDGLRAAQALADKVRLGKLADSFTARAVRRNRWRNLTTDDEVQAALEWLNDEGWLRVEEVGGTGPGSGRRTFRYLINPKVRS